MSCIRTVRCILIFLAFFGVWSLVTSQVIDGASNGSAKKSRQGINEISEESREGNYEFTETPGSATEEGRIFFERKHRRPRPPPPPPIWPADEGTSLGPGVSLLPQSATEAGEGTTPSGGLSFITLYGASWLWKIWIPIYFLFNFCSRYY